MQQQHLDYYFDDNNNNSNSNSNNNSNNNNNNKVLPSKENNNDHDENDNNDHDTIFALSSGSSGQATAVAVVRISGPRAPHILQCLLSSSRDDNNEKKNNNQPALPVPRRATLRNLYAPLIDDNNDNNNNDDNNNNNDDNNDSQQQQQQQQHQQQQLRLPLDQALVLYFAAPHSFTGESVVELHCHGSRAVLQGLSEALLVLGARYAEPGEFTSRAWQNGKLVDVLQVEALGDLLQADTATQRVQALRQLGGHWSTTLANWRQQLIAGLAHAEAVIDFGDDENLNSDIDIEHDTTDDSLAAQQQQQQQQESSVWGGVVEQMDDLRAAMQRQLRNARRGELVRQGLRIAIVGPPNAGKSSLFNVLAQRDAAIVSPTAGTTRDVLEVALSLGGVKCWVQDTAGVRRETADVIELEGMKRALRAARPADLVLVMVDGSASGDAVETKHLHCQQEMEIMNRLLEQENRDDSQSDDDDTMTGLPLDASQIFLVRNKCDLLDDEGRRDTTHDDDFSADRMGGVFDVSCLTQEGIDALLEGLTERVVSRVQSGNDDDDDDDNDDAHDNDEGVLITRARHRQHVQAAAEALERFAGMSRQGSMAVDMAAEELVWQLRNWGGLPERWTWKMSWINCLPTFALASSSRSSSS